MLASCHAGGFETLLKVFSVDSFALQRGGSRREGRKEGGREGGREGVSECVSEGEIE